MVTVMGVEARPKSGSKSTVAETEKPGEWRCRESHELTQWQGVGWIYGPDMMARSIFFGTRFRDLLG